ncbi:MAG: T9SS type A sorting domain-containing protein [Ignavibacteriales bacterium]|nr:T9SS type A sorting domain-containing protein [Ignavibacteriales bacterium]
MKLQSIMIISTIEPKIYSFQSECYDPVVMVDQNNNDLPKDFFLDQNYPNPFNPLTIINYQLPIDCYVTLKVYNLLGQEVATLVDEIQEAGYKSIALDGSKLPSAVYFYRMTAESFIETKKLLLAK